MSEQVIHAKEKDVARKRRGHVDVGQLILTLVLLVFFAIFAFIYFEYCNVLGLHFYKDEPLTDIVCTESMMFLVTEDGSGYMAGMKYSDVARRRNADRIHLWFYQAAAVRFHKGTKGKISEIVPNTYKSVLFLTDKQEVFFASLDMFRTPKLATGVQRVFPGHKPTDAYVLRSNGALYYVCFNNLSRVEETFVCEQVVEAYATEDFLYVLMSDQTLRQVKKNGVSYELSAPICENVAAAAVLQTQEHHQLSEIPTINVLTADGRLLFSGQYVNTSWQSPISIYREEDFTVIAEGVQDFALASNGTYAVKDGTVVFFGYDPGEELQTTVIRRTLPITSVEHVAAGTNFVSVYTADAMYLWGENPVMQEQAGGGLGFDLWFDDEPFVYVCTRR